LTSEIGKSVSLPTASSFCQQKRSPELKHDTKVLLLVGGPEYHDLPEHREILPAMLGARFDVTMTDDMAVLTPDGLAGYDVIANYTTFFEPTQEQCDALLEAVYEGKGYVGLHPATATFWNCPRYLEMIGGKFMVHDPNKVFTVNIGTSRHVEPHPITEGVGDFPIQDELYVCDGDMTQWQILARAEGHPVLWNKKWGKGRVHSNTLGHDGRALNNLSLKTLYLNAIEWAAGLR
jgi:type 1 glutamine amidotransferase